MALISSPPRWGPKGGSRTGAGGDLQGDPEPLLLFGQPRGL